jgi:hypothetical protein
MNIGELPAMNLGHECTCIARVSAFQFVIGRFRTATALPLTNHRKDDRKRDREDDEKDDGGFNEDDVMVAVSRFVVVVLAYPHPSAWPLCQAGTARGQGGRYRRFHGPRSPGGSARRSRPGTPGQRGFRISGQSFPCLKPDFSNQGAARRDRYLTHSASESIA